MNFDPFSSSYANSPVSRVAEYGFRPEALLPPNYTFLRNSTLPEPDPLRSNNSVAAYTQLWQLISTTSLFTLVCASLIARTLAISIYRLYFHPLSKFPGRKHLALTKLFEFLYDVCQNNEFPAIVDGLHEKFGPIVRVGPHEVSINDKAFHPQFFSKDQHLRKDPWWYAFGFENALFTTLDKQKHHERKQHMLSLLRLSGSYFTGFHPLFVDEVATLRKKITDSARNKQQMNLSMMLRRATNDTMRELMLGDMPYHSTDLADDADIRYHPLFRYLSFLRHFNFFRVVYKYIPSWFFINFSPMAEHMREAELGLRPLLRKYETMNDDEKANLAQNLPRPLMYALVDKTALYAEGDYQTAIEEFLELFWAGREAIGAALTTIMYNMIIRPECMSKLHTELRNSKLDLSTATYAQLRTLPYLDSVCKEGLRVLEGNENRAPRISSEPVCYRDWVIPAGYPISSSPAFAHRDGEVYPEPARFNPERWMVEDTKEMERCWSPFGWGSRACGGRAVTYELIWRCVANLYVDHYFCFDGTDAQTALEGGALKVFPNGNAACITGVAYRYSD